MMAVALGLVLGLASCSDDATDGTAGSGPTGGATATGGSTATGGAGAAGGQGGLDACGPADPTATLPLAGGALGTTSSISQWGITFTFEQEVLYGQFANGDYWVVAPVVITAMDPAFDADRNGWEVNPLPGNIQGFDGRIDSYDASRVPALPYEAAGGQSIIKGLSPAVACPDGHQTCLTTAAVLTVLEVEPPEGGAGLFRPPYVGTDKPFYAVEQIRSQCLPSLAPVADAPPLDDIRASFERVQLDHKPGWTGRALHPMENMPDYGSSIAIHNAEGALRLMLDDALEEKAPALVAYVQGGIDTYHMALLGEQWTANGGHSFGRKLIITFAAHLLGDAAMLQLVRDAPDELFGESGSLYDSPEANGGQGQVLYGQADPYSDEQGYWNLLLHPSDTVSGSKTIPDPYGMIDGGICVGCTYDFCCTAQPFKATAIAVQLVPGLRDAWNDERLFAYAARWVTVGPWAQPDPCAPGDGTCSGGDNAGAFCTSASGPAVCTGEGASCDVTVNWPANYGVTYGSDGEGGCILDEDPSDGIGRYPQNHGATPDDGYYGSPFASAMYAAYGPL